MIYAYRTDKGGRETNQDAVYVPQENDAKDVVMVADGIGGHVAGEIASILALEAALNYIEKCDSNVRVQTMLQHSVTYANDTLLKIGKQEEMLQGMGTTILVAYFEQNAFYCAGVGDSRLYVYNGKELKQVTKDHSLVNEMVESGIITPEQAAIHPLKHVLTRAVGTDEFVKSDISYCHLNEDDIVLLCTDGLYNAVSDIEIFELIQANIDRPEDCCNMLVERAIKNGTQDNVTVALVKNTLSKQSYEEPTSVGQTIEINNGD